ncbi:ATP-binding protein [Amycolatopsis nigrescens]|uniref:ATP-binding protein n=1 Tax=Amycolatopsis nigrescens TaxID=381445 RepID=UPI000363DE8F|nr:helix-turn-helix domain-containing protein [Amycolatopsis nigrescens]
MTFGAELRRLRQEAKLSLTELATRVHYSKGYLSKVETGMAGPNAALAALCDTEFGTGGTLTALLPTDAPRRQRRAALVMMRSGLPAVTPHFADRADELEEIRAAVLREVEGGAAVCAVHGMAGVGKTTLVVRCAHRLQTHFTDGVLFLDLRGHTPGAGEVTAAEALDRFLRILGVPAEEIPADTDDRAALYRDRLRGRSFLIVLDNARATRHLLPLVPAEPQCRVLVTSRHRLAALDDARHITLATLPHEQAAALFTELIHDHPHRTDDGTAVSGIVNRCGRLPLALRIAAARLRANPSWTLAELDQRLDDESARLGELDDGERSITATFQLSYRELPAQQQRLFGLLALHPGADLEIYSAAALAGADLPSTERLLAGLHDAHLITQESTGRYQFHDLIRTFARTIALPAVPAPEQRAALARLFDLNVYATDLVDRILTPQRHRRDIEFGHLPPAVPDFTRDNCGEEWLRDEWRNLVALCTAAGEHGFHDRAWQLAFALRGYFFLTKLWDPWIATCRQALTSAEVNGDLWAQATTSNNLGVASIERGLLDQAEQHYRAAHALFRELEDEHGAHTAVNNLAWIAHFRGDHPSALKGMETALGFYQRVEAHRNIAITQRGIALVQAELGDYAPALDNAGAAFATFEELGLDLDAAMSLNAQGWVHHRAERRHEAATAYRDALDRSQQCGSSYEAARAETGLGNVAYAAGQHEQAEQHWRLAAERHPNLNPAVVAEARARQAFGRG